MGLFLCQSEVSRKHPSDPTGLWHVAPREPINLTLTSKVDGMFRPHGSVVMGAAGLHSGWTPRRTREWGVAISCASTETGCRTVATAHELMKLFCYPLFICEGALVKDL